MAESSRRYNLRDTRKKPQGVLLKRWEMEFSKLINNENIRIPLETVKAAIRSAFEDGMFEQWRITLKCPLSAQRISVPARYADCTHIECFDLETFLRMKTQKNIRVCPICQKEVEKPLANLRIDKYMENVLPTLSDTMQVELMPDGSFTEVHEELVIEPNVIDDEEPYIQDVKKEALEESDECITLSDDEGEFMLDIPVIDMKPISLMPLNVDIKPNIAASSVPEQIHSRKDRELQGIESSIPLVPSAVPTTTVKTEQIAVDPITNHLHSATPKAVILAKRESPECDSSVPVKLPLQATLSSIDPTNVDSKPNIAASLDQSHFREAQEIQENTVQYQIASSSNGTTRPVTIVQNVQPSRNVVVNPSQTRSTPYQSYSYSDEPVYRTTTSPRFPLSKFPFQTQHPNPNTVGRYVIPAVRRYGYGERIYGYRERIPTKFPLNSSRYSLLNTGTRYEKPMNGHQLAPGSFASNIAYEKNRPSPVCNAREMRTTPLIRQPMLKEKTAPTSERGFKKGASNLVPDFSTFLSENIMPNATEPSSPQKSVGSEENEKDGEVKEEKQNRTERPLSCARILTVDEVRRKKYLSMQKEFMEKLRGVTCARTCITYNSWIATKRKREPLLQTRPEVERSAKPSTTITPSSPSCSSRIKEPVAPTTSNQCKKDMTFVVVEDILSDEVANTSARKPTVVKKERKKWTRRNPEEKCKPLRVLQRIGKKGVPQCQNSCSHFR